MNHSLLSCVLLATAGLAQVPTAIATDPPVDASSFQHRAWSIDRVVHDAPGDGRLWACGATWKASFGRDGFVYVPALGGAPRNFPRHLRLAGVRVGGELLPFAANAVPERDGDRMTFDRGCVREVFDLRLREVEQTFVVDTRLPGEVELELVVASELVEDAAAPGIQFGCAFGGVDYGDAFVVRGGEKLAIESACEGNRIRLRVPAALRGDGPLVIDPILNTRAASAGGLIWSNDVAWDETTQQFLVTWQIEWSASDHDVWTEMFDAQGNPIPFSGAAVDMTPAFWGHPRTANLNANDTFLVAAEVVDAQHNNRRMIYSRTRQASATTFGQPALLSNPTLPGDNLGPEVGADPAASGAGPRHWIVVWVNGGGSDYNVHGRLVADTGQPLHPSVLIIADQPNTMNTHAKVARSNGNGVYAQPKWVVVYTRSEQGSGWNVYRRDIDPVGLMSIEQPIDTSSSNDMYPQVSSPVRDQNGGTHLLITYERQSPAAARAVVISQTPGGNSVGFSDLTASFGLGPYWVRAESDGARFVVTAGTLSTLHVRTFACSTNGGLGLHDGPWPLSGPTESSPELTSRHDSGGPAGEYGVSYISTLNGSSQPMLMRYAGQTPGTTTSVLATGCNGLTIAHSGTTAIGSAMHFTLSNFGADFPGFGFGGANANGIPICTTCSLGLRLDLPILTFVGSPTLTIPIPPTIGLVGETYAVQGLSIGSGTCLGLLNLSDTVRFTIR